MGDSAETGVPGKDYVGVGVGGIILNDAGQVLLARRGPMARNRVGQWENPGGAIGFGEEFDGAIVREIREELGIDVRVEGLLRIVNHIIPGDAQHWVSPTLVCRYSGHAVSPCIREPDKCSEIGWFELDSLPEPLAEISSADLAYLRQFRREGIALQPVEWCRAGGPAAR